jgi:class 3 adenylate cyclase
LLGHRRKLLRAIAALDDALVPGTAPRTMPPPMTPAQSSTPGLSETHFEAPATGEREHVTVMLCGLVDTNGSSPSSDAEDWRGLVGAYLHAASIAVAEWSGTVAEKLDDGLIAFFAYPVTQEDDLERAVHAARAIQRSVVELNRRHSGKPRLAARIVIESGPTVIDGGSNNFGAVRSIAAGAQEAAELNALTIAAQQRQISAAEERDSHKRQGPSEVGLNRTVNDGRPMSYHQLIARAVDGLVKNTGEARRALYEQARNALVAQLGSNQPVLVLADITKERLALEEAIRKVEAEAARNLREPRTTTQDVRSAGTVGRALHVGGQSARRDRPDPSEADLQRAESSPVLFSGRNRSLSGSSTKNSDGRALGRAAIEATTVARQRLDAKAPETLPHQAAEQPVQFAREAHDHRNDLISNVYDIQQQRRDDLAYEPENDPPAQHTRSAPGKQIDRERRRQLPNPGPPSLPGAN